MGHCTDELLEKHLDGRCGLLKTAMVSAHLRKCAKCKGKFKTLMEDRNFISEVREAVSRQEELEKLGAGFRGFDRLRKLFGDDDTRSKSTTGG